jgi:hypothetical protein
MYWYVLGMYYLYIVFSDMNSVCQNAHIENIKTVAPGTGWTPAEFNHILTAHVVDCAETTFGCVEWESQLFRVCDAISLQSAKEALPFLQPTGQSLTT